MDMRKKKFTFSTLGIWRKIYIGVIWFINLILFLGTCIWTFMPEAMGEELGYPVAYLIAFYCAFLVYIFWIHTAICKRKTKQLLALVFIQIIPFMNPISALLFFLIYRTSKKEINV